LKSYIVRIYRYKDKKPKTIVGVVEEVGVKGKKAFTNVDELWEIFKSEKRRQVRHTRGLKELKKTKLNPVF